MDLILWRHCEAEAGEPESEAPAAQPEPKKKPTAR